MRVINVCISSSVHSIEAARSDRFIGGQLSERTMTCVRRIRRVRIDRVSALTRNLRNDHGAQLSRRL